MIDISISNLSKEFEVGKKILDGLTFQVDQGERVALLGTNGAGKTTLFKVLTGELDWDECRMMQRLRWSVSLVLTDRDLCAWVILRSLI